MGWLRCVGCLKIYVSLQNIGLFCRSLLQKRPIFLSILLIVATPYLIFTSDESKFHFCWTISTIRILNSKNSVRGVWSAIFPFLGGSITRMNELCRTFAQVLSLCVYVFECVIKYEWMSHVTRMNEWCHTSEWVMSHIWMSHVVHLNESCCTSEWVRSHIRMSHVRCREHIWMSHVTLMNESHPIYEWITPHIWTCRVPRRVCIWMSHVLRRVYIWVYVWYDSFICVTRLIYICDMTHSRRVYIWIYHADAAALHMCDMTQFVCVTWLIHTCDMTHSRRVYIWVYHDDAAALHQLQTQECRTSTLARYGKSCHTHTCMSHVTHVNESCTHTYLGALWQVMSHTHMYESCHAYEWVVHTHLPWRAIVSHVTHTNESCHTHEWVMSHTLTLARYGKSCHTHTHVWVMSHMLMSHVHTLTLARYGNSCHTHEWVMSNTWMSHVT